MKRFRFPLRPVAVLRSHQELRAREVFASAVHAYAAAEAALGRTRVHLRALEAALFSGRSGRFPAAEAAVLLSDYRRECATEAAAEQAVIAARAEMDKRRAEYVEVLEVFGAEVGVSLHDKRTQYRAGETVRPDSFDDNWQDECSGGIHFYITRIEAENH